MVIHTKKKAKIHIRRRKKASIKASSIYTVDRSPKIKGSKITTTENKKFRRSTIHPAPPRQRIFPLKLQEQPLEITLYWLLMMEL